MIVCDVKYLLSFLTIKQFNKTIIAEFKFCRTLPDIDASIKTLSSCPRFPRSISDNPLNIYPIRVCVPVDDARTCDL